MTTKEEPVSKVTFDQMADFKFMAAYEAYSRAFDKVQGTEERRRMNDIVSQLSNGEISYPRFYSEINRYQEDFGGGREFQRMRIKGQRKRAYRRDQQEKDRIKRHKR